MAGPWAVGAVAALVLAGCSHYTPAPIDRGAFAAGYDQRRLDPAALGGHAALLAAALRYSPAVRQAAASYASARAGVAVARLGPAPTLTLLTEYANDAATSSPWLLGAAADIPLDIGGRRTERRATADRAVLTALYDYGEAIWTARSALRHAEIERAAAAGETILVERLVGLRRDLLDLTERRVRAGENPAIDAARARSDLATALRRLDTVRLRRAAAESVIATAVGAPLAAFADAPADRLPAEAPAVLDPSSLQAWRREAVLSRADVLRAVVAYDQSEADLRLEVARQYPEVHLGPGYTWERGLSKLPFNVSLVLPPSDFNRAGIARAEAVRAEAGRRLEAVQAAVLAAADEATQALGPAIATVGKARRDEVGAAARITAASRLTVSRGESDRPELLANQIGELEAEIAAADANRLAWDTQARLEDALRRPFDPAETALITQAVAAPG